MARRDGMTVRQTVRDKTGSGGARQAAGWGSVQAAVLLLLAGFAVYGNALTHPFLIDDHLLIENDPRISGFDLPGIFGREYWPSAGGNQLYRPLTLMSLAVSHAICEAAWSFRVPNLLLHVAAGLAVYHLAMTLAPGRRWVALLAGLLFVVHPINSMALNQVVDRADLAAAAGVLWAAWLYLTDRGGWRRPVLAALLFILALLSKENAATLLGVFVVLDLYLRGRELRATRRAWWRERGLRYYLPAAVVLGAYLLLRFNVLGGLVQDAERISPLDNIIARPTYGLESGDSVFLARWGTPVAILGRAAGLLVWPHPLSWDYSYAETSAVHGWGEPRLWVGVAVLSAGAVAAVVSWFGQRRVLVALGLMLATYSVVSNTFVVIASAFAERYLYLPSAGFCLLVAFAVSALPEMWRGAAGPPRGLRVGVSCAAGAVLILLAVLTIHRNRDFVSEMVLNSVDIETHPRAARMWSALAGEQLKAGNNRAAVVSAQKALEIYPPYPDAWRTAGLALFRLNEPDQALACLRESFKTGGQDHETANVHVAKILTQRGEYREAISLLRDFVQRNPQAAAPRNNLAWYLLTAEPAELRDLPAALQYAREAVSLEPQAGDFVDTYVAVLEGLGRHAEAQRVIRDALIHIPADDPARPDLLRRLQQEP